jgi:hypothetical protein
MIGRSGEMGIAVEVSLWLVIYRAHRSAVFPPDFGLIVSIFDWLRSAPDLSEKYPDLILFY